MKLKILIAAFSLATLVGCQSQAERDQVRINSCREICEIPAIKEMTLEQGGGFLLMLGGGFQKEVCSCNRGS